MIDIEKTREALTSKNSKIHHDYAETATKNIELCIKLFESLEKMTEREFVKATKGKADAIPIEFGIKFRRKLGDFTSHSSFLDFSKKQLSGKTLIAIDGSQIMPSKEISYPIALIQSSYFKITFPDNLLADEATIDYDVSPVVLTREDSIVNGNFLNADSINLKRQNLEVGLALDILDETVEIKQSKPGKRIVFLDGTLVYFYLQRVHTRIRSASIAKMVKLLGKSKREQVPLVAYIDSSYAKDLVNTLSYLSEQKVVETIDASILDEYLPELGDYTTPFICKREPLSEYGEYKNEVCFAYLRVNSVRPVRIEFPKWIYDEGLYDTVIATIFAEAYISHGYPRVLTRAHEVGVLNQEAKENFNNLVTRHISDLGYSIKFMSKAKSKHKFY